MGTSVGKSLSAQLARRAIAVLALGVPFVAPLGLAQAAPVPEIPVYTANLDTNPLWGGSVSTPTTLDQITADWGGAVLNGAVSVRHHHHGAGLSLAEFYNPGSVSHESLAVKPSPRTFAFEYEFTVGALSNPQGTFVSNFGGLTDISLALYQGAPSLYQVTPTAGNPQGSSVGPLDLGVLSTSGSTSGEWVLQMAGLTSNQPYFLTVTGELAPHSKSGDFYGIAEVSSVPLPAALLLFGSAIAGLGGLAERRRLGEVVRKAAHGATRGAALAAALGLVFTALYAGGAKAAAFTAVANAVSYPSGSAGTGYYPLAGLILGGPSGQLAIPGSPTVAAPGLTSFTFEYQFVLTAPSILKASISQLHTTVTTGQQFELFAGTAPAPAPALTPTPLAVSQTGVVPGELYLTYAGPSGTGMGTGTYYLAVMGGLEPAAGHGSLSGTMALSAVPLPTALLLFGSALGGLALAERVARRKAV